MDILKDVVGRFGGIWFYSTDLFGVQGMRL